MTRFSIVVPAYQAQPTLPETLDAILAQTFMDWEAIVVDDGSTDETMRIAATYASRSPRIRAIRQENAGTAGAYNTGIALADGEFVVVCSADDILLPEHLERFSEFIDANPGYDVYSSNGYLWFPGRARDLVDYDRESRTQHSKSLTDVVRGCFYSVGAVYRRELWAKSGGYRVGIFGEDYDFWLRNIAAGARHRYLPLPLSLHRISKTQKSSDLVATYRSDIRLLGDLRDMHPLSVAERYDIENAIHERVRSIRDLQGGGLYIFRSRLERLGVALIGRSRARRVWHRLRALSRARSKPLGR